LIRRRVTCTQRLDALLEILGPDWICALGTVMTSTVLMFLSRWSDPHQALRLGRKRLTASVLRRSVASIPCRQAQAKPIAILRCLKRFIAREVFRILMGGPAVRPKVA